MYAWARRGRLCAPRMVWMGDYHYPEYELRKWRLRGKRPWLRILGPPVETRVTQDRWSRQYSPGKTGEWWIRKAKKKKVRK